MQSAAWAALLRKIPPDQHDKLMLVTSIGQEITLYALLDLAEDYLAIRGRLAGTTDAGRVFFVPYDQINYLGFQKEMRDATFRAMFDLPAPVAVAAKPEPVDEPVTTPEVSEAAAAIVPESPPLAESEPLAEAPRTAMPGKAALLERLRARAKTGTPKPPSATP